MTPTRCAALVLALFLPNPAVAQAKAPSDSLKPRFALGATQMAIGYVRQDLSSLNARLATAGLPRVASAAMSIGIGADVRAGRFILGAAYQSLITRNRADLGFRTRSSGSVSLFDLGYALVKTRKLSISPLVGAGATHLSLNIKELGDFAFDDALQSPRRELGLSGSAVLVHAGLLVERTFARKDSEFGVGVRAGVAKSVGSQRWDSDENRVTDGPVGMKGSYLRLVVSRPISRRRDAAFPMAGTLVQAVAR
jgi:hypothetical protein